MKKTLLGSLCLLLLLSFVCVSCANVSLPAAESKTPSEVLDSIAESLPHTNEFRGETLLVLAEEKEVLLGDDDAAGSVRSAIKNRNQLLESAYEMVLSVKEVPEDEIAELLKSATLSGEQTGDLLCYTAETVASLKAAGLLTNLLDLPYFDGKQCYAQDAATSLQTGASLYILPDPSAQCYDETYVIYYDRALVKNTGLALPETLVKSGDWTLETFKRYSETVAAGIMERPSVDLQRDVFGYAAADHNRLLPYLLWCGQGISLFVQQETGEMGLKYDGTQLTELASACKQAYDSNSLYPLDAADAADAFRDGRLGFYIDKLDYLKELYSRSEREYGLLPLPKANREQKRYVSPVSERGRVLAAPANVANPSRSGLGLTAICAAGGPLLQSALKQTYVTLYSLDNEQSCMLEMILDSARFDFGRVYGTQDDATYHLSEGMFADVFVSQSQFKHVLSQYRDRFASYAAENYR